MKTPKTDALRSKELENLERFHQKMKDEAEAWQKLLENLDKMKNRRTDKTEPKNPTER